MKPLEGIRVVDLSHVIAGPLASLYLAQLGADVIKIERPGGEVMRASRVHRSDADGDTPPGFAALNAGKRSFAVDLHVPEHVAAIRALAATADVFIENFRPGVVARYGLDYDAIRAIRPDIVYCSISGYGQTGPWAGRGAYDHVIQALTGMMMMSGDRDAPPMKVGFPVVDVAVGMLGALSITAAIHRRARDGVGQYIDASMVQASLALMYPNASAFLTQRIEPERAGNRGYTGSPTADTYRCADGWLATAANTPRQFRAMAATVGLDALCADADALDLDAFDAPDAGFVVARDPELVRRRFRDAFAERSAADLEERLNAVGVPAARVRGLGEFLDEAQATQPPAFEPVRYDGRGAPIVTPGLGFRYRFDGAAAATGAPSLGEHDAELFAELAGEPTARR